MSTVKDLEVKAVPIFNEVKEMTNDSAVHKMAELPDEEKDKYVVGSMNIFTCGMWCKATDRDVFPSDVEWIKIVDDWNNLVVLPHAESLKKFIEAHPDCDIPQQVTGIESGNYKGIFPKQAMINGVMNL